MSSSNNDISKILINLNQKYKEQVYIEKKTYRKINTKDLIELLLKNNIINNDIKKTESILEKAKFYFEYTRNVDGSINSVVFEPQQKDFINKKNNIPINRESLKRLLEFSNVHIDNYTLGYAKEYLFYDINKDGKIIDLVIGKNIITKGPTEIYENNNSCCIFITTLFVIIFTIFLLFLLVKKYW